MLEAGSHPLVIIASALLVNIRILLYSASLAPWFRGQDPGGPSVAPDLSFAQRRPIDERRRALGWVDGDVVAVQGPRYKYILNSEGEDEFYDLLSDPTELHNLVGTEHAAKDELGDWLRRKLSETN